MNDDIVDHRRLIIAGTGIAGLSAAIYAARSNNDPLLIEGDEPGGQLTLTTDVENYPGFPEGISGPELINDMKAQATKFGAETRNGIIADVSKEPAGHFRVELTNGDVYTADAVIAASGASARTLGVPGEDELMGYGLSTCATCDGAFFRGEDMLVVGGGDAAMEEANFLTKFADTVYIAHRREEFRAEDVWIDRVTLVEHPDGHPKEKLDDPATADEVDEYDFDVGAVFFAIGHTPNTDFLEGTGIETDDDGYLITEGGRGAEQPLDAGDVVDFHYQQAATASGMGVKAALDADEYLSERERAGELYEGEVDAAAADD